MLEAGDKAPDFTLTAADGSRVSSSDYRGRKLVVYFYPKAFTSGCTTQACDFRDRHEAMAAAGYELVGISPDQPGKLAEFRQTYELPFRLLSDPDHEVASAFGAWGTKKNYGQEYEGIIRSTFVIDEDGRVEHAWYNVRATGHGERLAADLDVA